MKGDNHPDGGSFPDLVWEMASAFRRSRVLLTAVELDLFSALGPASRPSSEVAGAIDCDPRATDRLMNALVAMGLLQKSGERFANVPDGLRFLARGSPDYLAGLMHSANLWDKWSTLTDAVRAGGSVQPAGRAGRGEEWIRAFISAMHDRARLRAESLVSLLDLGGVRKVLDLGGGSGGYAAAVVRAGAGITATVFDRPEVVPLTRRFLDEAGCSDTVQALAGDFHTDDLGSDYDLVLISAVLHSNTPVQNCALLARAASVLNPGGRVVIRDFIMGPDRTVPLRGALFSLNMLVNTAGGDTYTEEEYRAWMKDAGLVSIRREETSDGDAVMIGTKPA